MSRPIKAQDVRPGQTVRGNVDANGVMENKTFTPTRVELGRASLIHFYTGEGSPFTCSKATELTWLDSPEVQLPTEPGSIITAFEVRGVRNKNGWRLMYIDCKDFAASPDNWISETDIAEALWHHPDQITDWLPEKSKQEIEVLGTHQIKANPVAINKETGQ